MRQRRGSWWTATLRQVAALKAGEEIGFRDQKPWTLAERLKAQIGGPWRAHLAGGGYAVLVRDDFAVVRRTV